MTSKARIIEKAVQVLEASPKGLFHFELVAKVCAALPNIPLNTVKRKIVFTAMPPTVYKAGLGLYRLAKFRVPGEQERARPARDTRPRRQKAREGTSKARVVEKAVQVLEAFPKGLHHSQLVAEVCAALPNIPLNTVKRKVAFTTLPPTVYKAGRGLYELVKFREQSGQQQAEATKETGQQKIREHDFYAAFGDWLINELEECTRSICIGGNCFKDKWGTPDVIGVREPRRSDIIKPTTEIVSAEIKLDQSNLITAFGQACSYRLFSHKSYVVVPNDSPEEDIGRLDALSRIFGIGLVVFNPLDSENPGFEIRSRAAHGEPDMFYVNKNLQLVEDKLFP